MTDCRAVLQVLWEYIDGELSISKIEELRKHIEFCKCCHPEYAYKVKFLESLAALKKTAPPTPLALEQRVREFLPATH